MTFGDIYNKGSGYLSVYFIKEIKEHGALAFSKLEKIQSLTKNVATIQGREWAFTQLYGAQDNTETTGGANWIGISQDGDPINQTQSVLAGEITTGGLGRAQGELSHIGNTNVGVIDNTFTASAANFDSPGIRKGGLFYQSAPGGVAVHLGKINPTVAVLDTQSIKITATVNINIPT